MRSALLAATAACAIAGAGPSLAAGCKAESADKLTPVIELFTSEGCSSCPPADRWLSSLKPAAASGRVVVEAFHVGYWDDIGWIDRFASPVYSNRQREIARREGRSGIYTPQVVRNGRDWRDLGGALAVPAEPASASIVMRQAAEDAFEASVTPAAGQLAWGAYWTVTEDGHSSRVKAGENAGEFLRHDFVVRQYVAAGEYRGPAHLKLRTIAAPPAHPRRVNLIVFDPKTGKPLQALSLGC